MGERPGRTLLHRGRINLQTHVSPVAEKNSSIHLSTKNADPGMSSVRPKKERGVGVRREEGRGLGRFSSFCDFEKKLSTGK